MDLPSKRTLNSNTAHINNIFYNFASGWNYLGCGYIYWKFEFLRLKLQLAVRGFILSLHKSKNLTKWRWKIWVTYMTYILSSGRIKPTFKKTPFWWFTYRTYIRQIDKKSVKRAKRVKIILIFVSHQQQIIDSTING